MADEMEEIIAEFTAESEETLDALEPLFVELETNGHNDEIINKLFRGVHTIKGAAGFLGFQSIVDVAHNAESIMKKVRDGAIELTMPLADAVLRAVDMLRLLFRHIRDKDGVVEDVAPLVGELKAALETALAGAPAAAGNGGGTAQDPGQAQAKSEALAPVVAAAPEAGEMPAPQKANSAAQGPAEPQAEAPKKPDRSTESPPARAANTLRVEVDRLDRVMDLTGEVVLVRNRLLNIATRLDRKFESDNDVETLHETVSFLDLITSDMQMGVMRIRMLPLQRVFGKFPRLVRDLAAMMGKQVDLEMAGEETEVDRSIIENIGDPLVHIIRNSIDHGFELPDARRAAGKPERGLITITAAQKGNQIVIDISDDGRGIDVEKVKGKALERGLITPDEAGRMTDEAVYALLFLPGFSTAERQTEVSGRGVGMDVVKTNVAHLSGSVEVRSEKGRGTTFSIRLPLTLAIIQTLMVRAGGLRYAVPLAPVEETIAVTAQEITTVAGAPALVARGHVYPFVDLAALFGGPQAAKERPAYAVVTAIGEWRFCIGVAELLGQEEVVIKSVDGIDAAQAYILGATITGDGKVVFILDPAALAGSVSIAAQEERSGSALTA